MLRATTTTPNVCSRIMLNRKKAKTLVKHRLESPYRLTWPRVEKSVREEVLQKLQKSLEVLLPLKSPLTDPELVKSAKEMRGGLAVGINEVTRGIEKGQIDLLLVCLSEEPAVFTQHLISLSCLRRCHAVGLCDLSKTVAHCLGVKRVTALGFKTAEARGGHFQSLVEFVKEKTPDVQLDWLQATNGDMQPEPDPHYVKLSVEKYEYAPRSKGAKRKRKRTELNAK
ncbi:ribonuclease P protein subunit p38-like [Oscarella lobularis]|uniref:ribonuclease P protein subunit p38-like n=1 Tax=Oscarella lobularis TaxID=121494 RepID=UPI0033141482